MQKYDVIIIGSGLGGLATAVTLSREGMNVCVLEQQVGFGGCCQSFRRKGYTLDTGIHYVGSLCEGQIMHQYFKYYGVMDRLNLQKLDAEGFDLMCFGDGKIYPHAMGYERFVDRLVEAFPEERAGIVAYSKRLQEIGKLITVDVLRSGRLSAGGMEFTALSAYDEIASMVQNPRLRGVLAGSNRLYSGLADKSSFYEHAMINHSNIEGAHCFVGGTQHMVDALVDVIRAQGGEVRDRAEVTGIHLTDDRVSFVEVNGEERLEAKYVISAIHPATTLDLLRNNTVIKKAFFTRVRSLENSFAIFTTYLMMKPGTFRYENRNYFLHGNANVWLNEADYKGLKIPSVLMCMQPNGRDEFADVVTLLTPMCMSDLAPWLDTKVGRRGADYEAFKAQYAERVIDYAADYFPHLRDAIAHVHTASPLTYRDYTGTPDGSAYGIVKDYHNPIVSHLPARTKIANLFLTGQNLNVHGCLGVAVSSAVTCSELLGMEYLAKKIGNA